MTKLSTEEELKHALTSLSELSALKTPVNEDEVDTSSSSASASSSKLEAMNLLTASTPHISTLKKVNRHFYTDLQTQKTLVAEERSKVDTARLALQNLKYEEAMLELEVKVCQEFQSIFQDIQLHSLDEFHALRKQRGETQDDAELEADGHKLMLARLKFELGERKRLEAEKQKLQVEKTEVGKENKEKKVKLEQTEKTLKDLEAKAQALQATFESF